MDGLFDVFDEQPNGSAKPQKSRKRHANGEVKDTPRAASSSPPQEIPEHDGDDSTMMDDDVGSDAKRLKKSEPEQDAIVTDDFETEQSREVAAAAGLQAQKEGSAVVLSHQVRHQVALPPDYNYIPLSEHVAPEKPAKTYAFPLDPFQQVAVASIERNESVLVSAHTSAGKTVCAEYAIAQCLKNVQRVVYTSPIKALSNQKYREFQEEFGDVGLMTGDVTINPTASCLVMTTEILRSMLYRGSEIMREVAWVIFDEVHYMRDKARGVVWEETIILLPDKVRYVFLSATIPNAMQFAEWIVKTHNQPCHVVYTDFRPTPLQHYLFPQGAEGIHLVVDEKGVFREENFSKAMASVAEKQGDGSNDPNAKRKGQGNNKKLNKGGTKGPSDIWKIVRMIMMKSYNPVIVFSFSKRECEAYALQMSTMAFNDDNEKSMVQKVFQNAISMLSEEDQQLPQIQHILPLLRRGIGIHHSGLLPILKETIEILFQENLIKVLFATETFSIGLNMPARTVVFTSVRKFDGISQRLISPSEFIQMSGRAGRRGIDERGIVIMMIDEKMEPEDAKTIVRGEQDKLNSAFYLGYNMILNLMRVEGISPEFMLERCFFQFQNSASVSGMEKQLRALEEEKASIQIEDKSTVKEYYDLRKQLEGYNKDARAVMNHPTYCLQFIQPGRLVQVSYMDHDFGWGVVVNFSERKLSRAQKEDAKPQESFLVEVLLNLSTGESVRHASTKNIDYSNLPPDVRPAAPNEVGRMEIVPVLLSCVDAIGQLRVFLPKDLKSSDQRNTVRKSLNEVRRRFPEGVALLDPVTNMGITDDSFKKLRHKIELLESRLAANPLTNDKRLPELYTKYVRRQGVADKIKAAKKDIQAAMAIQQLDELKNRKRVLRRLGFINDADVVLLKARVACEISTGDELVLAELLLSKFFNDLTPEVCAACLSCFIFEEKSEQSQKMDDRLAEPFRKIQQQARVVARVSQECKLETNEEKYIETFKPELMEVVFAWCNGSTFAQIW